MSATTQNTARPVPAHPRRTLKPHDIVGAGLFSFGIILFLLIDFHAGEPRMARLMSAGFITLGVIVAFWPQEWTTPIKLTGTWAALSLPLALVLSAAGVHWPWVLGGFVLNLLIAGIALGFARGHRDEQRETAARRP